MNIVLFTPPFTQLNTPYPATTVLSAYLKAKGHNVSQYDLGIELAEKIFCREFITKVFAEAYQRNKLSFKASAIASQKLRYENTIDSVWRFLRGKDDTLAPRIAVGDFLPKGLRFKNTKEDNLDWAFGTSGFTDRAKHIATLYIEDLADFIAEIISKDFGLVRYAEQLTIAAPTFDALEKRLNQEPNIIDLELFKLLDSKLEGAELAGFSVPFPGTMLAALRSCQYIKAKYPSITTVLGGGYINTELRDISCTKIFDFADYICYDDGELPMEMLCVHLSGIIPASDLVRTIFKGKDGKIVPMAYTHVNIPFEELPAPDFSGFKRDKYISLIELSNPMHKMWSDGRWNKMTMAHGCYWAKCAFCDTSLDYISRYEAPSAEVVVSRIEQIISQTGITGFHFTDEALPPKLLGQVCQLIIDRNITLSFWGNIRFEKAFTPELCHTLKEAGCIAVSGGLEVASERVLSLIGKGVTVNGARECAANFADEGIMVHAYLMYGFPTQTFKECSDSLKTVCGMFSEGIIQSAFWHRYTMTLHSPSGKSAERYGCKLCTTSLNPFANNAIEYTTKEDSQIDWDEIGKGLSRATYNYMHGLCYDLPMSNWLQTKKL